MAVNSYTDKTYILVLINNDIRLSIVLYMILLLKNEYNKNKQKHNILIIKMKQNIKVSDKLNSSFNFYVKLYSIGYTNYQNNKTKT